MQRIGSPSYDELRQPVSGRGFGRGCHAPSDGPRDGLYEIKVVRRVFDIFESTLGRSHPKLAVAAANPAGAYIRQSKPDAAAYYPDYAAGLSLQASLFRQTAQEIVAAHALRNPAHAVVDIRALSGR